jgi:hypothetical protein
MLKIPIKIFTKKKKIILTRMKLKIINSYF